MASRFPLCYGGMYNGGSAIAVTIANTTDYVLIGATWTTGLLRNTTFTNSYGVTVTYAGIYLVNSFAAPYCATANQDVLTQIFVGSSGQANSIIQTRLISLNITYTMTSSCILSLAAGDEITLRIRNSTGANNINMRYCNVNVSRIGL